ncbi:drug/metabolite transporter (DMT)-like permease [Limnobacter thiooxidans]|uniref:DMT family transporter n=1 Tax=Limnobacter thiooxidans TaxID=131080 RepID=A0AA86MHG8_9BURK|nr:drug/metabolite transporter (DMT)-like permease [Limnobacter thiooxidans]BET25107.1 DMT family transporter [Limnobacter thiooxidans]
MSRTRALLERSPTAWGVGLALLGAIFFSGKAIVVKLAYAYPVDASTLLAMRMLLSLPLFLGALIFTTLREKNAAKMTIKDYGLITLAGLLGYYLASLFDFMGLQYITAGLERLILFTYPSIVLLISCAIKQRWPEPWQLMCMALSYVGLAVVYGHETVLLGDNTALGVLLVFVSAVCYASYLIVGERLLKRLGTIRVTAMATLVSATAILIQINLQQPISIILDQPLPVWGWSLVNAVFCTFVPVFSVMTAISLIGAPRVSQLGMIGPIATIALGTWILKEPFTIWHAAGTALVILGVALLSMKKTKEGVTP